MARSYPKGVEGHHTLFPRALHTVGDEQQRLRQNRWLIPPLEQEGHDELHSAVGIVPVLDNVTASRVARAYEPVQGDYMSSIENLMSAYEVAASHPRVGEIERDLTLLAVEALDRQRPYIQAALWRPEL